jgi:hypothetical protein
MGSGETSPTMVKVHRRLLSRLGDSRPRALLLGTPFGFQENAEELAARVVAYFETSLSTGIEVGGLDEDPDGERLFRQLQAAHYVFSGPGSPTYALRRWTGTTVPTLLGEKLTFGGAVTFSSAAALTLGSKTVPVYEIYKVGADPFLLEGLDVLSQVGLNVTVVPHYDNAEGGTHDTRYCYLGERRLRELESRLESSCFVLGIDEHTACMIDLDAEEVEVGGLGFVTLRRRGESVRLPVGTSLPLAELVEIGEGLGRSASPRSRELPRFDEQATAGPALSEPAGTAQAARQSEDRSAADLGTLLREDEAAFRTALETGAVTQAVAAILDLEEAVLRWATDTTTGGDTERARVSLRSMVTELGELAAKGAKDPRILLEPFVDAIIGRRDLARSARRYDEADGLRDLLVGLGVELHDDVEGTTWDLG